MKPLQRETLQGVCDQMASHDWSEADLNELIEPKMGIITGFQNLLEELEVLRKTDLGSTPPALGVQKR